MIRIEGVSKKYGRKEVLREVSLDIGTGEIIALIGENGAGKSTLLKCIPGYLKYKGSITMDGSVIDHKNLHKISFAACEHSFFPGLTGKDHEEFYRAQFPDFRGKRFGMLMDFFDLPRDKKISSFSAGGQNQFEVIMALCQGAEYILMDEPFAGNDIFNREDFYKMLLGILEPEETILMSTHLINEVSSFISRAVFLHEGKLLADMSMEELENRSITLLDFTKQLYHYREDRVIRTLDGTEMEG